MNKRFLGIASVLPLALAARATSQSAEIESEMQFVRGLVTELRFIDQAQFEIEALKKKFKDSKSIAQLAIEVSLQGAKRHPEREQRIALYREAIDKSVEFVERYANDKVALDARVTLTDACIEFGMFLNEELEIAREEAPDKVANLEEKAAAVFRQGVTAADKCAEAFTSQGKETDAAVALLRKGILLREHARAVKKDRGYLCDTATEVLEELVLDIGEETILGQKALFEMSKIEEVKGNLDAAITSYSDAISSIDLALKDENVNLPESAQRVMFGMMQEIYDQLATVTLNAGRPGDVAKIVDRYKKSTEFYRAEPDARYWDSVRLTQARVNATSGSQTDVSEALKVAKAINETHPHDYVGLKAKNLIRTILRGSADLVTGELLLEVATGDFQEKNYDAAIAGFKRALNGMTKDAVQTHGFETWNYIGRCNESMQRYLEASFAYTRATEGWGAAMKAEGGEAERKAVNAAKRAVLMISKAERAADSASVYKTFRERFQNNLNGIDISSLTQKNYTDGLKAKNKREYVKAAASFFRVDSKSERYELALGHGIMSLFRAKKYDEAKAKIAELRKRAKTTPIDDRDTARKQYRPQALAWAHYAEGRMLYEQAKGGKDSKPDLTKFKAVEKHFLTFEVDHGEMSPAQMPKVHEILGHAYLEMGDEAKATARYTTLKALGESRPDAHKALGALMFETYLGRAKALDTELRKGGPNPSTQAKFRANQRKALDMGLDYARTVGKPQYPILYNAMRLAEDLEAWPKCESAAERIVKLYGDKNYTSLRQVKPLLGYAILRQPGRMQEALTVLKEAQKELEPKKGERKSSGYFEVRRYMALALGGWPAFDKDGINYEPNPGLGKPDEAYKIYWFDRDFRKYMLHSQRAPRFSLAWYRYHLEVFYFATAAKRIDNKFETRAQTLYNIARNTDNFGTLKKIGPEGVRLSTLFTFVKK